MFALVDCDNFFVSCERIFRPDLQNKPVVVLSGNDGCVIARSNEAKALGIAMAVPYFKVKGLAERNYITLFSSNLTLYGDISKRVMSFLGDAAPAMEVYSIDEAFLDFRGMPDGFDLENHLKELVKRVGRGVGVPISIGVAPTKTLAKLAANRVKKRLDGSGKVYILDNDRDAIRRVLKQTSITDAWGIGHKSQVLLRKNNIESCYDFVNCASGWVKQAMSATGLRVWSELRGEVALEFDDVSDGQQRISNSRTFSSELYDFDVLSSSIANFISNCTTKLRAQNSAVGLLTVYIQTNRFRTSIEHNVSRIHRFDVETDAVTELVTVATHLLQSMYKEGIGYKRGGVIFSSLVDKSARQTIMFDTVDRDKQDSLMNVMDDLNSKFGSQTIISARKGFKEPPVKRKNLSPCYTTSWGEIIEVKC